MRSTVAAIGFAVAIGALGTAPEVLAQTMPPGTRLSPTKPPMASELSAQRRRPRVRVRIYREDERGVYPAYYPGPNAVRDCNATYVKEYRPSGTVIVPRMNCFWRPGQNPLDRSVIDLAVPIRPTAIVTADAPWMMSADRVIAPGSALALRCQKRDCQDCGCRNGNARFDDC